MTDDQIFFYIVDWAANYLSNPSDELKQDLLDLIAEDAGPMEAFASSYKAAKDTIALADAEARLAALGG